MLWFVLSCIAIGILAISERSVERAFLAASAGAVTAGALLVPLGDLERAALLTVIIAIAIAGASRVKYHHSGIKLTLGDFPLVFAGTVPFLLAQYRRAAIGVLTGGLALLCAAVVTLLSAEGNSLPAVHRAALLALAVGACAIGWRLGSGAAAYRSTSTKSGDYISTFAASIIDVSSWLPSRRLVFEPVHAEPLALLDDETRRHDVLPDIIVIQHESIFDPRLFGLAVDPRVGALLSPPDGISGTLNVDIYGGGSWQSEFSLLTGLSSASFGRDAYFIQHRGVDRFHHTLPRVASSLGYRTLSVSSCRRRFFNYEAFYRSIGIGEQLFSDDLAAPFDIETFEKTNSDSLFLDAAGDVVEKHLSGDEAPLFAYLLTNFNHGPHDRRLTPVGQLEEERAFAAASLNDPQYIEYYARLAETAYAWQRRRARLAARFPDRPILVVHYGDHQPVMTRRIERSLRLPPDTRRQFRTFYAMEGLNWHIDRSAVPLHPVLDIAFLGTVAMRAAGLPLDGVSATRASLIDECGEAYFATRSERKDRFHRTLVEAGLVDTSAATSGAGMLRRSA